MNSGPVTLSRRLDDFGIDYSRVCAVSRTGLWDNDPEEHLNVHSAHQVIAVEKGMLLIEDGYEKRPLYQDMAALIPAQLPHRATLMHENIETSCHSLFVSPEVCAVDPNVMQVYEMSALSAALLRKLNERNLVQLADGVMGDCLSLFLKLMTTEPTERSCILRLPEVREERNRRIVRFIWANYMNKIRLEHLCRVVPLSVRQISRSFRDELGISVMDYVKLYRLLQASTRLLQGYAKIADIACDCGYDSASSFYEDFVHHFGMPPNQFRRKAGPA